MSSNEPARLGILAKLVLVLAVLFILSGIFLHGVHLETMQRLWNDLVDRPGGSMTFRFILQPTMAAIAALHDGVKDARTGRSPYFWTAVNRPDERADRLREALNATARIVLLGIGMDAIYQWKVYGTFYPVEALDIAILLALAPYLLLRRPIAWLPGRMQRRSSSTR